MTGMPPRALLALAVFAAAVEAGSANLIVNGDFERANPRSPIAGWKPDAKMAQQIFRLDSKVKHGGRQALAIELVKGFGKRTSARLTRTVPIKPKRWYLFRAFYRRDNFVYGGSFVVSLMKGKRSLERHSVSFRSRRWKAEEIFFNSGDADWARIDVITSTDDQWRITIGGTIWLDDMSLLEMSPRLNRILRPASARLAGGPRREGPAVVGAGRGRIEFSVPVAATARYYLWLKWRLPRESSRAAVVSADGAPAAPVAGRHAGETTWTRPVTPTLQLEEGLRRVRIEDLMKGARLEEIHLTPNPCYYPPGGERLYADGPQRAAALRRRGFRGAKSGAAPLRLVPPVQKGLAFRERWPLTQGVPFARGQLAADTPARLVDGGGRALPTQTRPLAFWPDGSVQWLLVNTLADVDTAKPFRAKLEFGPSARPPLPRKPARVTDQGGRVTVDTGAVRFTIRRDGFRLLDALAVARDDGRFEEVPLDADFGGCFANGDYTSRTRAPREILIEESGPVRALIKVAGTHRNRAGQPFLDYVVRLYAYAGEPFVRVEHTFIARRDRPCVVKLDEVALRLPVAFSSRAKVTLGTEGARSTGAALTGGPVRLVQDGWADPKRRKGEHSFAATQGAKQLARGKDAAGWVRVDDGPRSVFAGVRHFWQNFPKGFEVSRKGLSVQLVPKRGKALDFYRGAAKTHEVLLDFGPDAKRTAARWRAFQGWPLLLPEPEWTSATGALGSMGLRDPARFAAYEHQVDVVTSRYFQAMAKDQDSGFALGLLDFGDKRGDRGFNNLETALGEGMMLQFFRTGRREYLDFADVAIRHFSDVDIDHSEAFEGGIYVHGPHRRAKPPRDAFGINGHSWFVGVRDFYFLTGNPRFRDQARQVGKYYLNRPFPLLPRIHYWRRIAWQGKALLAAYEMTGDARFLKAAGNVVRVTDYQKDHIGTLWPYMFSVGARVVRWYWEKTDDPTAKALFLNIMDDYLAQRLEPDDNSFGADPKREGMLLGNYPAARELNFYNELAAATRMTGDERYVRFGAKCLNIQTKFRVASDVLLWGTADLLGAMQRLGIPGAKHFADLRWVYCVHDPRMVIQVVEKRDQPFVVNLYTSRSSKYCADFGAVATLYGPRGRKLATKPVRTGGLNEYRFDVPRDGRTGVYTVVVDVTDFWRWALEPVAFDLKPGKHTLRILGREKRRGKLKGALKKTKLDRWALTDDPLYRPRRGLTGRRPGREYVVQEAESSKLSGSMGRGEHAAASGGAFIEDTADKPGRAVAEYRFSVKRGGRYRFTGCVGQLSVLNRWLFVSVDGGEPVHFHKIHSMTGNAAPVWSLSTSLGSQAVVQYWYDPGHKGNTYYRSQYLRKDGPVR